MYAKNKFEQEVQEKLGELKFNPSASVWENIESALPDTKKTKGKRILWGSMLAAAAITGALFFYKGNLSAEADSGNHPPALTELVEKTLPKTSGQSSSDSHQEISSIQEVTTDSAFNLSQIQAAEPSVAPSSEPSTGESSFSVKPKKKTISKTARASDQNLSNASETNYLSSDQSDLAKQESGEISLLLSTPLAPVIFNISKPAYQLSPIVADASIAVGSPSKIKENKKWSVELNLSGGQSIFNNGNVNKLFTAADPFITNSGSFSPGMTLIRIPTNPSEVRPGISFSMGADLRRRLSKQLSVTAGVQYSLITTQITTGNKRAMRMSITQQGEIKEINEFYELGAGNDYTNHYHFVELPVLLHAQLNKGKKIPLSANAGFSVARLISTDALHYDGAALIYYEDKDLFNKTSVQLQGGVSATFFAQSRYPLQVGPQVKYGLSSLLNQHLPYAGKHALFLGIKASLPISF